jgi:hypothetical protein
VARLWETLLTGLEAEIVGLRANDECIVDVRGATIIWQRPGSTTAGLHELCLRCLDGLFVAEAVATVSSMKFEEVTFWKSTTGKSKATGWGGLTFLALSETR